MASIAALGVGSGLDLNGLLNQLESAERQRLQPLIQQKASYQAKISAYGKLEGALAQFQTALTRLEKPETFAAVSSKVSNDTMSVAADATAVPGSYQVVVDQLASHASFATLGIDDSARALAAGSVSFSLADGTSHTIDVSAEDTSLASIRDAINAQQQDVTASIINDGDANAPYRLVLNSNQTGAASSIETLSFSGFSDALSADATTQRSGSDAEFSVNGLAMRRSSNQVQDAIQGVTLNLQAANEQGLVTVARDESAINKAVKDFVKAFNSLNTTIRDLGAYDAETQRSGRLLGDTALRDVQDDLRALVSFQGGTNEGLTFLSDLGIERELDGSLALDEDALQELVSTQLADVTQFFTGAGEATGFAGRSQELINQLLDENGILATSTEGMKEAMTRIDERYAREEVAIASTVDRYRSQFAQLDSMIASMNSTSAYLTQQFDALSMQLGRKK
ncbi:flagellar filament capping protein FliD [Pseudidiomarina insulisalsae]|uniref:Flagellar hook-associated protein 2 n=1 Tax=Pseudidiomarina insulisalsae TaxID=575789 RepID=A0A432YDQ1_9GAMM|nr:flagellar filament capping protein FliD [Pseudidiomarina insulisalsae]RUO59061.1 flagellar hook protein [Pseudidiomarina insulisalsae]